MGWQYDSIRAPNFAQPDHEEPNAVGDHLVRHGTEEAPG
jgi:hypothetical protein